ncbi:atos homolog protein A isoform 2-T2 [Anomaloglossus baeobatrachus]|uniref:atos homolog protein A isoform X2 n=1 Tax=Anomaloglossus baeobatrachus TaxID=238106 RepID=UPI003F4FB1A5
MVEVMLLPDCCYSDEASGTEANDFNDPAMKQDALLLERWTLEPVPRQSGDRFIEEKTLLLAIRSFVFFSQLSAWLSVSHGAVPRNIIYRVSAADGELQWNFTHSPTEHVFPVPNVSHNVALKVSVQSLPRQSSYPVLNCSIHSSFGFYEKRFSSHEQIGPPSRDQESGQQSALSAQHTCSKQTWTVGSDGLLQARTSLSMNLTIPSRNVKLISGCGNSCDVGTSPSKIQCFNISDPKTTLQGSPVRNFKSLSLVDTSINSPIHQPPETNPLIGSLIQERQEVIARIAQHLLQCDQTTSRIPNRSFKLHDPNALSCKVFRNPCEDENLNRNETPVFYAPTSDLTLTPETGDRKLNAASETPITSSRTSPDGRSSPKPQARRKLVLVQAHEPSSNTFQHVVNKPNQPAISLSSKENIFMSPDRGDLKYSEQTGKYISKGALHHFSNHSPSNIHITNHKQVVSPENRNSDSIHLDNRKNCSRSAVGFKTCGVSQAVEPKCTEGNTRKAQGSDYTNQLHSIENYVTKDRDSQKTKETQEKPKPTRDENEDPAKCDCGAQEQGRSIGSCARCERLKYLDHASVPLRPSNNWKKKGFHSLDGISTKAFHPCTGLPLLSSPVPQRKSQSGYFDLDTSLLQFNVLSTKRQRHCEKTEDGVEFTDRQLSCSAPPAPCLSLLGNFEESVLNYRLEPLGTVKGFTADVGASGVFCPTHMTLPVRVSFFSVSEDNAPSPYMGNITLESLGKRGYRIPPSGTIQVTLFNPNKTVVKMFVVKYDLQEMPPNHQTFLRQRTFSVPVKRDKKVTVPENIMRTEERTLRYLIHLRFQSSKSGKIYLHKDVRLLFSRKSMEVDSGAAYELKSYIDTPTNPQFSPRC